MKTPTKTKSITRITKRIKKSPATTKREYTVHNTTPDRSLSANV